MATSRDTHPIHAKAQSDQELAHLRAEYLPRLPEEDRNALYAELRDDQDLTKQVHQMVTETLSPVLIGPFLFGCAWNIRDSPPGEARPILAGIGALLGLATKR